MTYPIVNPNVIPPFPDAQPSAWVYDFDPATLRSRATFDGDVDTGAVITPGELPIFTATTPGAVTASGGGTAAFLRADGTWATPAGSGGGTVNSVSMTVPAGLAVTGSPVTNTGTLALTWSGTIPATSLPNPSASTLGGTQSGAAPANQFMTGISVAGVPTFGQPAFANLSGSVTAAQLPAYTGDVTSAAGTTTTTIAPGVVTLTKMAPLAANSVIGNNTGSAATPVALSQAQLTAMIQNFSAALSGDVPASGGGAVNYLRADGTWATPPGNPPPVTSVFGRTGAVVAATNDYAFAQIAGQATLAQLPTQTNNTVLGNVSGSSTTPVALTQAQLTALVNQFTPALAGDVPASGGGTANFLRADGTWQAPPGGSGGPPAPPATTPPGSPVAGQLWWDNVGGQLYVWTGAQWVAASCCGGATRATVDIVIAAVDSSAAAKAGATIVCTGTNDDLIINAQIDSLVNGGTVTLMPGTYSMSSANGILIDRDWITLRCETNSHWSQYISVYGATTQQSATGAPGGAKLKQTNSAGNGVTIGQTIANMHGTTASGALGDDARHKGICIENLYLSGPGDQPFAVNTTVAGTPSTGTAVVTVTSSAIPGSPITCTANLTSGDTATTAAGKLVTAINTTVPSGFVTASNVAGVVTIRSQTQAFIPQPVYTVSTTGTWTLSAPVVAPNAGYGTGTGISDPFTANARGQRGLSDICRIQGCSVIGFLNGIEVGWDTGTVRDNNLQNLGGFGIKLDGLNTYCAGNLVFDLNGPGIWGFAASALAGGHRIIGNVVGDVGNDVGITLSNTTTPTNIIQLSTIGNNIITGAHTACIVVGNANNCNIINNICNKTAAQPSNSGPGIQIGISSLSGNNNIVIGNQLNEVGTNTQPAITTLNSSQFNFIEGNSISGNWASGAGPNVVNGGGVNQYGQNAGQNPQVSTVSFDVVSTATAATTSGLVAIIYTSGAVTLTLPTANITGQLIRIVVKAAITGAISSASSNVVPLGTLTAGTAILSSSGKFCNLVSDGANWQVVASG